MSRPVKLRILAASFLLMLLMILTAALLSAGRPADSGTPPSGASSDRSEGEPPYTIGVFDGKVAVFTVESPQPVEVYDVYIQNLPLLDQQELAAGIPIADRSELKLRIEDYIS